MKRFLLFVAMLFISLGIFAQYVDLGLPSGTLWYAKNEGGDYARYTYDVAVSKFGSKLPTKEQLKELSKQCTWSWTGSGYKVVGPNGNSIYLPAAGYGLCSGNVYWVDSCGKYWSSSTPAAGYAYFLSFTPEKGTDVTYTDRCEGQSVRLVASSSPKYVDLGLPSGTLWRNKNEGGDYARYTYDEAVSKFGNNLPTVEQIKELRDNCTWTWTGSSYKVVGPNGNSIYLPAAGYRGCLGGVERVGYGGDYWSSMPDGSDYAFYLYFYSDQVNLNSYSRCSGHSVRLVASPSPKYVDLGLPSGTLWRNKNEGGDYARYTYDEAVSKFGNKLPTKEQLEELKNQCTWTWTGSGYKVVGPNGNSIYFPAAGRRNCDGDVGRVGSYGSYWSSTPYDSEGAYRLRFDSGGVGMGYDYRCVGLSVRLVQD